MLFERGIFAWGDGIRKAEAVLRILGAKRVKYLVTGDRIPACRQAGHLPRRMKVLFVCKGNMARSTLAAALYNKMTNTADATSAGTYVGAPDEPEGRVLSDIFPDPSFFEVLEEHDIHVRNYKTVRLTEAMLDDADVIVSMAEEPFVPGFLKNHPDVLVWNVENPETVDRPVAEKLYKELSGLVKNLL